MNDSSPGVPLQELTLENAALAEAAMVMAVRFFHEVVAAQPLPPPPYPKAYSFRPTPGTEIFAYFSGYTPAAGSNSSSSSSGGGGSGGSGGEEESELRCQPRFPAASAVPPEDSESASTPGLIAHLRPPSVVTVGDAMRFHRAALRRSGGGGGGRDDDGDRWWHAYGLANALWECETVEGTAEAVEIAQQLLLATERAAGGRKAVSSPMFDPRGPDPMFVKKFLLDLLLEAGRWADAIALLEPLLHAASNSSSNNEALQAQHTWLWTQALLVLRTRGVSSKRSKRAVAAAVASNPHVLPLLVRDAPLDFDPAAMRGTRSAIVVRRGPNGERIFRGNEAMGQYYVYTYGQHWWRAGGQPFLEQLRTLGEDALQDVLESDRAADAAARRAHGGKMPSTPGPGPGPGSGAAGAGAGSHAGGGGGSEHRSRTDTVGTCAACGQLGGPKAAKLRKCSRCEAVVYCSVECQKSHWKAHKPNCREKK